MACIESPDGLAVRDADHGTACRSTSKRRVTAAASGTVGGVGPGCAPQARVVGGEPAPDETERRTHHHARLDHGQAAYTDRAADEDSVGADIPEELAERPGGAGPSPDSARYNGVAVSPRAASAATIASF